MFSKTPLQAATGGLDGGLGSWLVHLSGLISCFWWMGCRQAIVGAGLRREITVGSILRQEVRSILGVIGSGSAPPTTPAHPPRLAALGGQSKNRRDGVELTDRPPPAPPTQGTSLGTRKTGGRPTQNRRLRSLFVKIQHFQKLDPLESTVYRYKKVVHLGPQVGRPLPHRFSEANRHMHCSLAVGNLSD